MKVQTFSISLSANTLIGFEHRDKITGSKEIPKDSRGMKENTVVNKGPLSWKINLYKEEISTLQLSKAQDSSPRCFFPCSKEKRVWLNLYSLQKKTGQVDGYKVFQQLLP